MAAPDLPGLGESASPPEPQTAEDLARIIADGLEILFPGDAGLHRAGFSFGEVLSGRVAAQLGDPVSTFTVVGSNGLGLVRQPTALERLPARPSEGQALAVVRHNLAVLMIADRARIDEFAVYIQSQNAPRARVKSGGSREATRSPASFRCWLYGIWGARRHRLPPSRRPCPQLAQHPTRRAFRGHSRGADIGSSTKRPTLHAEIAAG